jgi:hypothetical protein
MFDSFVPGESSKKNALYSAFNNDVNPFCLNHANLLSRTSSSMRPDFFYDSAKYIVGIAKSTMRSCLVALSLP